LKNWFIKSRARVAGTGLVELELLGCLFPGFSRAVAAAKNIDVILKISVV